MCSLPPPSSLHPQFLSYPTDAEVDRDGFSEAVDISGDGLVVVQVGVGMCINGVCVIAGAGCTSCGISEAVDISGDGLVVVQVGAAGVGPHVCVLTGCGYWRKLGPMVDTVNTD